MITAFATNKTFTTIGITSDTSEPYVSTIGFRLELRNNAIGGGKHYAVAMVVIETKYEDVTVDRTTEKAAKIIAKAEAVARCEKMNTLKHERETA